jgi:uncharacterized protein YkwD
MALSYQQGCGKDIVFAAAGQCQSIRVAQWLFWRGPGIVAAMSFLLNSAAVCVLLAALPAQAADDLAALINGYRAAPSACQGRKLPPAPPLAPHPALSRVELRPGSILIAALDQLGYEAELADAVQVSGPADARSAFEALSEHYCSTLLGTQYAAIGVSRRGDTWTVVLAQPSPDPALLLPPWAEVGQQILAATNAARAQAQDCGGVPMAPAGPLAWNDALGRAALAHSEDMARRRYFSHKGKDGRDSGDRARAAGYSWRRVGENISLGQVSAEEAVAGWLSSPGHCANLMNPGFTEMGAAYAIREGKRPSAYWTQVFGTR